MNLIRPKDFYTSQLSMKKINRSKFLIDGLLPPKFFISLDYGITRYFHKFVAANHTKSCHHHEG